MICSQKSIHQFDFWRLAYYNCLQSFQSAAASNKSGVQIDLIIDRKDGVVNLCEMKFAAGKYALTAIDDNSMTAKKASLCEAIPRRKTIHVTYVTTFGLEHNAYWNNVQAEVTLDDLFDV